MIQRADLLQSVLLCPLNLVVTSHLISTSLSLLVDLLVHIFSHSCKRDLGHKYIGVAPGGSGGAMDPPLFAWSFSLRHY